MKRIIIINLIVLLSITLSGQTVGKIGGIEDPARVGSVRIDSVKSLSGFVLDITYKSCKEILANNPTATDGIYTIDPDGDSSGEAFDCFCDMTTDGGGWTMVGYYNGLGTYTNLMKAGSDVSYGTEVGDPNPSTVWSDWRVLAGVSWPIEYSVILDQTTFSSGWEDYAAKVIYKVSNRDVMPNFGTIPDINSGTNLIYRLDFSPAYTDVGSTSLASTDYWYPKTSAQTYLIVFNNAGSGAYYGAGVPGGNNSWHHIARMFIR